MGVPSNEPSTTRDREGTLNIDLLRLFYYIVCYSSFYKFLPLWERGPVEDKTKKKKEKQNKGRKDEEKEGKKKIKRKEGKKKIKLSDLT